MIQPATIALFVGSLVFLAICVCGMVLQIKRTQKIFEAMKAQER